MNGAALTAEEIDAIAQLPSRDVLYGRLVGMVASPLTGLAAALGGLIGGLARQLQADRRPGPRGRRRRAAAEAAAAEAGRRRGRGGPEPRPRQPAGAEAAAEPAAEPEPSGSGAQP